MITIDDIFIIISRENFLLSWVEHETSFSLGEERANLSTFRTFVRFVLWICRFSLPLGVWEVLQFVIVSLPGTFYYLFFLNNLDARTTTKER